MRSAGGGVQTPAEAARELWFELLLARDLGMTVRELMDRMDCEEFEVWKAAYGLEPWGERRDDWRMHMLMVQTANFSGRLEGSMAYPELAAKPRRTRKLTRLEDHLAAERMFARIAGVDRGGDPPRGGTVSAAKAGCLAGSEPLKGTGG